MTGIYTIKSPSEKIYVGQSRNLQARKTHYKGLRCLGQRKLYNSLVKYGWSAHVFKIVCHLPADVSPLILDTYEQLYMDCFRAADISLLNLKEAGITGSVSEESRRRISEANKGKTHSPEVRDKLRLANLGRKGKGMFGKKHTISSKLKMKEKSSGKPAWNKGKTTPEEIRLKQSEAAKKRVYSEDGLKRLIEKRKARIPWNKGLLLGNRKNKTI